MVCACLLLVLPQPIPAVPLQADGVAALLARLEGVLRAGEPAGYMGLLSGTADRARAREFADLNVPNGATRVVLRERDRQELVGTLPGDGYQLTVEVLIENGQRGSLTTWRLDVRRKGGDTDGTDWGIANQEEIGSVQGLYRLSLRSDKQYTARNLVLTSGDLRLSLPEGSVFMSEAGLDGAITGMVLLGRGEMTFAPAPANERGQVRAFAGADTLETPFDAAFVRLNPGSVTAFLDPATLTPGPADPRELKRADEVFREEVGRSFSLDLGDLSPDNWSLIPGLGDILAEVRTRRFDTLTYARAGSEVEDVTLFDRRNRRNISVYSSKRNAERYGRSYNEDEGSDFEVVDYDIDASFNPDGDRIEARAVMTIEVTASAIGSLSFRLADELQVQSVTSIEFGRMLAVRVRDQSSVLVNLPSTLTHGYRMSIAIEYAGSLPSQPVDREALAVGPQFVRQQLEELNPVPPEDSWVYSNRSYWYPQPGTPGYATGRLRLSVPAGLGVAASGDLVAVTALPAPKGGRPGHRYDFVASQPARYFGWLITPLREVRRERISIADEVQPSRAFRHAGVYYDDVMMTVQAQPRVQSRARQLAKSAADIVKFYSGLAGDAPYATLALALVERNLPGGHSPPYMAIVAQQSSTSRLSYRDDPASFPDFPEFFLAHELAHQWWGQGVGWKNYHEQWLSEGFAQYFAALYAEKVRGSAVFASVMRRMARFGADASDAGPIWLGYRVGHVRGDSRAFRAVVYDKSAAVLHMLRGLVGDDAFFRGIRRFLADWKFKKAGTDDFRAAMEAEAGRPLGPFFERWIYGTSLPRVTVGWREAETDGQREAVVRIEQDGDELFEFPLQVSVENTDRVVASLTVAVTGKVTEARIPLSARIRGVEANRDGLALVTIK